MGWLRKKGRQLKKGIGKLFSTKLGRIVGTIGLSMAMGWAARSLMQGAQSLFATAPPVEPGISEVVAEEVAEEAVEEVTTETLQRAASNLQETITSSKDVLNSSQDSLVSGSREFTFSVKSNGPPVCFPLTTSGVFSSLINKSQVSSDPELSITTASPTGPSPGLRELIIPTDIPA